MTDTNPLLEDFELPHLAPPFDRIEEAHFLPAVEAAIAEARRNVEAIRDNLENPDFENTIVALECAGERLSTVTSIFYNQLSAAGTDGLEALAEKIGPLNSNFSSDVALDAALFARVQTVYDSRDSLNLTTEQKTLLEDSYKGFVRGGALLNDEDKAELRAINEKMSVMSPAFMNNVKKSAEGFELLITDEKDLSGLPPTAIAGAAHAAQEKGKTGAWLFTLDFPSYIPFLTYADNRALREQIWRAFNSRAFGDQYDNCENIKKIVSLRHERAKLLGYKDHPSYVLERRMAKDPDTVSAFLHKLLKTYKPAAEKDLERLQAFAREQGGPDDLKPWDIGYYSEKLKESLFHFSSEDLRPYFPLDKVVTGVFGHFSRLFGLRFEEAKGVPVWHPDVIVYEVHDERNNRTLGLLYADLYPRTGKKDGAWMTSYREQGLFSGEIRRPVIAIVCNFTRPAGDTPSLISFDEVVTLFHEMGHAIHGMLSDVTYSSQAGTNVLWDFVELPSQVQENWAYTKETLDLFAAHYQTGEKIPAELVEKLNKAKNFMVGWGGLRQVNLGLLDMAWHTAVPEDITDIPAFEDAATADSSFFPRLAGPVSTSFSHIFAGGYAAGYYSYKWAEVLDADTFALFEERGLYDRESADRYRTEILARGGSEDPVILYRNFRGRDADPDALLRREGLL